MDASADDPVLWFGLEGRNLPDPALMQWLGARRHGRPPPPPLRTAQLQTLPAHIECESLQLCRASPTSPPSWVVVEAMVRTLVPTTVHFYALCRETVDGSTNTTTNISSLVCSAMSVLPQSAEDPTPPRATASWRPSLAPSPGVVLRSAAAVPEDATDPPAGVLDLERLQASHWEPDPALGYIPIVLALRPSSLSSPTSDASAGASPPFPTVEAGGPDDWTEWTYAALSGPTAAPTVRVLRQKIDWAGQGFELRDVYGLREEGRTVRSQRAGSDAGASHGDGRSLCGSSAEEMDMEEGNAPVVGPSNAALCVVCLSEPRTTLVLPCRHVCLCRPCAEAVRQRRPRCPLCRAAAALFLDVVQPAAMEGSAEGQPV